MTLTEKDKKFAEIYGISEEEMELYSYMYDREMTYKAWIVVLIVAIFTILAVLITKLSGLW